MQPHTHSSSMYSARAAGGFRGWSSRLWSSVLREGGRAVFWVRPTGRHGGGGGSPSGQPTKNTRGSAATCLSWTRTRWRQVYTFGNEHRGQRTRTSACMRKPSGRAGEDVDKLEDWTTGGLALAGRACHRTGIDGRTGHSIYWLCKPGSSFTRGASYGSPLAAPVLATPVPPLAGWCFRRAATRGRECESSR